MDKNDDSMTASDNDEQQQALVFDKTTEKGADNGLFRACMVSIRSAHISANRLRTALVISGLFTDKTIYREVIALFYAATNTLEQKIRHLEHTDEICRKLLSLGYSFGPQYEQDLTVLYPGDWKQAVAAVIENSTDGAKAYLHKIETMTTGSELAGAAFCLWGALIIGGGAAAMPRVKALCGEEACHLFTSVTGPGRGRRKADFIQLWDTLASKEDGSSASEKKLFEKIVAVAEDCMQGNNELITSVKRNPWWLKFVVSTAVGVTAVGVFYLKQRGKRQA